LIAVFSMTSEEGLAHHEKIPIRLGFEQEHAMKNSLVAIGMAAAIATVVLMPQPASAACGNQGVYVFDAYWCPYCKMVKEILNRNNVRYTSIDITTNARARAFMAQKFNTSSIPVTVVDDSFVVGFNEARLRQLLCL
jgi:glutaredoxin